MLQDAFVDAVLDRDGGYFVDIGAGTGGLPTHDPAFYSNTFFFEKRRGWSGLIIDYDENFIDFARKNRVCSIEGCNLLSNNINDILSRNNVPAIADYLSLDVDDAQDKVFNELDFNKYQFRVITLEHNLFHVTTDLQKHSDEHKDNILKFRELSRERLRSYGYNLVCEDVVLPGYGPVEDWYLLENTHKVVFREMDCNWLVNYFQEYRRNK